MGLLDDAIRDHLELKRRHGADAGEVARIENEALSAARRDPPPPAADELDEDESFDREDDPLADLPYRDAEPDEAAGEFAAADRPPASAEHGSLPRDEAEAPVAHHHEPEPEAVYEHELADVEPEPEPEPAPPAPAPAPVVAEEPEDDPQATQQFSLEELDAQAARDAAAPPAPGQPRPRTPEPAEPGEEDVLEETPEFLQETPEHDRLWFEQKPPKDFDF